MIQRQLFRLSGAVVLSGLLNCAHAVELGDTLMRSHIGQPLSADIELTGIVNEAATVQAGLADPDVYRGANIAMHPALAALNITIVRREGRRFLHVASAKAVDSAYVHIFFELTENGRRSVRQTTLWLTPDPNPAPPPAKGMPVAMAAVAPAAAAPVAAKPVAAAPAPARVAVIPFAAMVPRAAPVACVQQFTAAQIGTCAALDAKNAALTSQIVELEEKVRVLTAAMQAGPAVAAPVAIQAAPARPAPVKAAEAPAVEPAGATPWLFIFIASAAIFALAGVLGYLLWRKRKQGPQPKKAGKTGAELIASVKNRLMPAKKETAPIIEPTAG